MCIVHVPLYLYCRMKSSDDCAGNNEKICFSIIAFGSIGPKAFLYRHLMQFLQHVCIIIQPDVLRILLRYQHWADCIELHLSDVWPMQPMRGFILPCTDQSGAVSCQTKCHSVASFCVSLIYWLPSVPPHLGLCGTHLIRKYCGCQKLRISEEKSHPGINMQYRRCRIYQSTV